MKIKTIIILIVIALLLTISTFFIKIIPCKSWYGSNTGIADLSPHNTLCKVYPDVIGYGPHNEYFYRTDNPTTALFITLAIFLITILVIYNVIAIILSKHNKKLWR
jgi:hypothetical protein